MSNKTIKVFFKHGKNNNRHSSTFRLLIASVLNKLRPIFFKQKLNSIMRVNLLKKFLISVTGLTKLYSCVFCSLALLIIKY